LTYQFVENELFFTCSGPEQ